MGTDASDVLKLLAAHELAIGRLYESCALAFGGHRELWQLLASEERSHAGRLENLEDDLVRGAWRSRGRWLRTEAVRSSIAFVEQQQEKVQAGQTSVMEALALARDLENSLLEKQFANLDESIPRQVRAVFQYLATETMRHRALVEAALEGEKRAA